MNEETTKDISKGVSILIVFLISLLVSIIVSLIIHFYISGWVEKKQYVRVPDIRNLPVSEAAKKLNPLGLKYEILEEIESEVVPAGSVVLQQPLPKTLVKKNTEVIIVLSKGIPMVKIPEVKQKTLEEAKKIIVESELTVGEIKEIESDIQKGLVVDTEPQASVEVKKGTPVNIIISKGKEIPVKKEVKKVEVPNIINKSLVEAKKILESHGLRLGNIKKVCDEDKDFDIIISQSPQYGTKVPQGSKVDVVYNAESE